MMALRIVNWARYLHADCKRGASNLQAGALHAASPLPWVKCPTSHTGLGFLDLMDHPDGMAHFGAWVLILETAARCPVHGLLVTDGGRPLGPREFALKTRGNAGIFKEAIARLLAIGWLEEVAMQDTCKQHASNLQDTCKQMTRLEERRGEETRQDHTTPQRAGASEGGQVEVNPDANESDPVTVTQSHPIQPAAKPVLSFLDWVNAGHPRVQLAGESLILWRGLWDQYRQAPNGEIIENRAEVFGLMYASLVKTLEQPRFKIWPTAAQEWLMKNCPIPQGIEA